MKTCSFYGDVSTLIAVSNTFPGVSHRKDQDVCSCMRLYYEMINTKRVQCLSIKKSYQILLKSDARMCHTTKLIFAVKDIQHIQDTLLVAFKA